MINKYFSRIIMDITALILVYTEPSFLISSYVVIANNVIKLKWHNPSHITDYFVVSHHMVIVFATHLEAKSDMKWEIWSSITLTEKKACKFLLGSTEV